MPKWIVLVPAAWLLLPAPAHAQWNLRVGANYQDARYGGTTYRTSTQELTARRRFAMSEETSLAVTARLLHDVDFGAGSGIYRGFGDADFRSRIFDLSYRLRPEQQTTVALSSPLRQKEQTWAGALRLGSGPEIHYREGTRWLMQDGASASRARIRDQRLDTSWRLLGLDLNYTFNRSNNQRKVLDLDAVPVPTFTTRDHTGGVAFNRSLFRVVQVGGSYRRSETRSARPSDATNRISGNVGETQLSAQLWRPLTFNASAGWTESRARSTGRPDRFSRYLDGTAGIAYRPVPSAGLSVVRSFQQQRGLGNTMSKVDALQTQLDGSAVISPEFKVSGTFAHSEILSSRESSAPSDQLTLGLRGCLRPGADLTISFSGSRFVGVPSDLRYQLSQTAELRLRPAQAWMLNFAAQAFTLGSTVNPGSPDRVSYRIDSQFNPARGGSFAVAYTSQTVRQGSAGETYSLSGTASVPWRGNSVSWTVSGSPRGNQGAAAGRGWRYSSSVAAGLRLSRWFSLNISQSRSFPTGGKGDRTWSASFQRTIR